jgi:hypothetical protein
VLQKLFWKTSLGLAYFFLWVAETSAQDLSPLELARICVSECGWDCSIEECQAIHLSLSARAAWRRIPTRDHAQAYAPASFGRTPPRLASRAWIAGLSLDAREPAGWWAGPWSAYRARWLASLELARQVLQAPRNPCRGGVPMDWGVGRVVRRYRARNRTHALLDCGPTRNIFLCPRAQHCGKHSAGPHYQANRYPEEGATIPRVTLGLSRYGSSHSLIHTSSGPLYLCSAGFYQGPQVVGLRVCNRQAFIAETKASPEAVSLYSCREGFLGIGQWKPHTRRIPSGHCHSLGRDSNRTEYSYQGYCGPCIVRKVLHGYP